MAGSERPTRKSMRYPVRERVSFWWKEENGNQRQGEGTSRDISETGAFVLTPDCPPVGAEVELSIFFSLLTDAAQPLRMELEGQVLRVEQTCAGRGSSGFAVLTKGGIYNENAESDGEGNPGGNDAA